MKDYLRAIVYSLILIVGLLIFAVIVRVIVTVGLAELIDASPTLFFLIGAVFMSFLAYQEFRKKISDYNKNDSKLRLVLSLLFSFFPLAFSILALGSWWAFIMFLFDWV
ncbi:hypothetical protein [Conchiformibius steedae]|uniref:hypothetical protein n=1 Tax=Conchiformibius steedae TaxID=153493 RepID=UPI0026F0A242|nr:hypothetical protein [Conchiformibius steedae]